MLGSFMQSLEGRGSLETTRIPFCEMYKLAAGTPVVAVQDADLLRRTGLPTGIRFGIATHDAQVILQEYRYNDMHAPRFEIASCQVHKNIATSLKESFRTPHR